MKSFLSISSSRNEKEGMGITDMILEPRYVRMIL